MNRQEILSGSFLGFSWKLIFRIRSGLKWMKSEGKVCSFDSADIHSQTVSDTVGQASDVTEFKSNSHGIKLWDAKITEDNK